MSYEAALQKLFGLRRFGVRPGLEPIQAALDRLGNPERAFPAIHIAGTNGKGSTAAMADAILRAGGRRVGLYTSPHLARFTERIRIDGQELDRDSVEPLFDEVQAAGPELTFFELVTAMAFLAFARARIDIAVVEVGLGGRLDATNVLGRVYASVITGIALEHTEVLGSTEAEIAREKAGILRPHTPAFVGAVSREARTQIAKIGKRVDTRVQWLGKDFAEHDTTLLGPHQRRNAALAIQAIWALDATLSVEEPDISHGLQEVRWPGRLELVDDVLFDGAHNADGALALAAALPAIAAGRAIHLVLGVVEDKDAAALFAPLAPLVARVIATTAPTPRARAADALASLLPGAIALADPEAALAAARAPGALTVVAGSLFLVGFLRARLLGERVDPIAAQDPAPTPTR